MSRLVIEDKCERDPIRCRYGAFDALALSLSVRVVPNFGNSSGIHGKKCFTALDG